MAEVELRHVDKFYGSLKVVDDISFKLADHEFLALLGPSGCGKTTTLRMLGGFTHPDAGEILVDGVDITGVPPERRPTAMVFQNYALWPHMTVAENIGFGLRLRKMARAQVADKTAEILRVVGLERVERRYPAQLSGGQQQRVALARALVLGPQILLLDEPLSNLDAKLRVRMRDEIRRIQQDLQITTVYVTHDQEEALTMADRIAIMHQGRIQQIGNAVEVYERPQTTFVADFIGSSNFFAAQLASSNGATWARVGQVSLPVEADGLADGTRVTVSVRPEDLEVVTAPGEGTFPIEDARLVNFGAYKRLLGRNSDIGEFEVRVGKDFVLTDSKRPLYGRILRARAFTEL